MHSKKQIFLTFLFHSKNVYIDSLKNTNVITFIYTYISKIFIARIRFGNCRRMVFETIYQIIYTMENLYYYCINW